MSTRARRRSARRDARRRGFTLVEMMIATVILSAGILTMAMMQLHALRHGAQGRHTSDAAAVGRTFVEQAHRLDWSVLTAAVTAGGGSADGFVDPGWQGATPTVNLQMDTAGNTSGPATWQSYDVQWRVQDVAGNTCLRDVEIRVEWAEEGFDDDRQLILGTRRYNWGGASC